VNDPAAMKAFENDRISVDTLSQQNRMPRTIANEISNTTGIPLNKGAEQIISRQ